jgi:hypothetical protein
MSNSTLTELQTLLASRAALIIIESREEARVLEIIREASFKAIRGKHWGVFHWAVTEGLKRIDRELGAAQKTLAQPDQILKHLKATPQAGIYVLLDFHPYLTDAINVRMLKDIAQQYHEVARTVVLLSHEIAVPGELAHLAAHLKLQHPTALEREKLVREVLQKVQVNPAVLKRVIDQLAGLAAADVTQLTRQMLSDGVLDDQDLQSLGAAKYQRLKRGSILSYEADLTRFADVGGLKKLRRWITQRKAAFDGSAKQLDAPKGILLLGVQGCGKSLGARAIAGLLGIPLVRLEFSALYSKWQGESEKNLLESLHTASTLAPCVLWIDELEKAIASGGEGDGGVSRRVLGTFLTWLAETRDRVFVVATANDISALPPELVRKGRFDEIFFVDLPDDTARVEILKIHSRKRGIELTAEQLALLSVHSQGFSGAELEQAIISALYSAHAENSAVSTELIIKEIQATQPLSVVMAENINALRSWAAQRTVAAD